MGPDDLVIHKSIQLYDLSLEETIYRSDKKKKKVERICCIEAEGLRTQARVYYISNRC